MPLNIIVIGAGIGGLASAIAFRRQGHHVTVYERRFASKREDSGSGVTLQGSVGPILAAWNILDEIATVAHDSEYTTIKAVDGTTISAFDFRHRGRLWYGLRSALKDLFRKHAIAAGAKLSEGTNVEQIDLHKPQITLADGTCLTADLIVAADGARSQIRQTLFPNHKLSVKESAAIQVTIPLDQVHNDPLLNSLLDGERNTVFVSPGRAIFASPAPHQNIYDLQLVDDDYTLDQDPNPGLLTERWQDLSWLKQRFQDHTPAILRALERGTSAFKWRFTEVSGLPSWSSPNGRVVLLGDSKHSMAPYAGYGSSMCIEDAAILAELLRHATPSSDFPQIMRQYEEIRRPRCEKFKDLTNAMGRMWCLREPAQMDRRNAAWREANDPEQCLARYRAAVPNCHARYGTPAFQRWSDEYDVMKIVKEIREKEGERAKL